MKFVKNYGAEGEGIYIGVKTRYKCFENMFMFMSFTEYTNTKGKYISFPVWCQYQHLHRFTVKKKSLLVKLKAKEVT